MLESLIQATLDRLPFEETYHPLGFPVVLSTNSQAVLDTAHAQWSMWRPQFDRPPFKLIIEAAASGSELPPFAQFRMRDHLASILADAENFAICDTRSRLAAAWITTATAENPAYVRYHFLDSMAYYCLTSCYLVSLHAACIARSGRATLLCGDSKAGKSTLAYASARRGWTYITDDASYLVRGAEPGTVAGNAHFLRLRPDAKTLFPELASACVTMRGNGKAVLEIPTATLPIRASTTTIVDRVILLRRNAADSLCLSPLEKSAAREWFDQYLYTWDAPVAAQQRATLEAMIEASSVYSLEYSDLDRAIDLLEQ